MVRRLVGFLSIIALVWMTAGCKNDGPTSKNFDPKGSYKNQQQPPGKGGGTTGGGTTGGATTASP